MGAGLDGCFNGIAIIVVPDNTISILRFLSGFSLKGVVHFIHLL